MKHCDQGLTVLEVLVSIIIVAFLLLILLPPIHTAPRGPNLTKNISNAKQIYLGLKMYAGDNDDAFPGQKPSSLNLKNANEAFRELIPNYVPSEVIFYVEDSPWTPTRPDNIMRPGRTLTAGENHWAYTPNLKDKSSNPYLPILADGFAKGTPGTYDSWIVNRKTYTSSPPVVVIRADGSGRIESAEKTDFRVYGDNGTGKTIDLFKPAPNWLRLDQTPLNPEG